MHQQGLELWTYFKYVDTHSSAGLTGIFPELLSCFKAGFYIFSVSET
jgi:hypothetical protein